MIKSWLKLDWWMASPSRLPGCTDDDPCCKACSSGLSEHHCKRCKWKDKPITVKEILKKRGRYR